jgi:hypothetical protein
MARKPGIQFLDTLSLCQVLKGAWVPLFRYEGADTCRLANGTGEGGREGLREFIIHLSPESPRLRWPPAWSLSALSSRPKGIGNG